MDEGTNVAVEGAVQERGRRELYCWGRGDQARLGTGVIERATSPTLAVAVHAPRER